VKILEEQFGKFLTEKLYMAKKRFASRHCLSTIFVVLCVFWENKVKLLLKCGSCFSLASTSPEKYFICRLLHWSWRYLSFSKGELVYLDISDVECKLVFNSFPDISQTPLFARSCFPFKLAIIIGWWVLWV